MESALICCLGVILVKTWLTERKKIIGTINEADGGFRKEKLFGIKLF